MIKIFYRSLIIIFLFFFSFIIYLSTIGIETDKFNDQISTELEKINNKLEIDLNKISIILDPFTFKLSLKTVGATLKNKDKSLILETIKSDVDLKTFLNDKFSLSYIKISTRSLEIKNLISFLRLIEDSTQLFILEKFIKNGYLIANVEIKFDEKGKINKDYKINGFVKDGEIKSINEFKLSNINFNFNFKNKNLNLKDIELLINGNTLLFPKLNIKKKENKLLVSGESNNKNILLEKKQINQLFKNNLDLLKINLAEFDMDNTFSFSINNKYRLKNFEINSILNLKKMKFSSKLDLTKYFPESNEFLKLRNHQIQIEYKKNFLNIKGRGDLVLQKEIDNIKYKITKSKQEIKFDTLIKIKKNPFNLNFFNFQKILNSDLELKFKGKKNFSSNETILENIIIKEGENIFEVNNLLLSKTNKVRSIDNLELDYIDKDLKKNKVSITKKNKSYELNSKSINATKLIDDLLKPGRKSEKNNIFQSNFKVNINVKKTFLDNDYIINNLKGYLFYKNNEVVDANLESFFSIDKKVKLTIKSNSNEKIITLYSDIAKPFVSRYKFIKGFEEGNLDFYSIKKKNISNSKLIIDNFKVQEVPALAKLLTLASLQGIADLLTGEGIRFTDFEMSFSNENKSMKINELYAIGPAISILMDGYVESNELISLRGTLVPATTINRTISSIPLIGNILVGKKVGEGVFGVSFKIKGPPTNLKTTVNPVKTLTPRFITRTLEKIKKN